MDTARALRVPGRAGIELISPTEVMRQVRKSNILLDSLYAIPPLLLNLGLYGRKDTCIYVGFKGNVMPVVLRRTLGFYALSQHSPPQLEDRRSGTARIDTEENIRVLRAAYPAMLVKLRQHPFDDPYLQSCPGSIGEPRTAEFDLRLDVGSPIRNLYQSLSKDHRNRIRRALALRDDEVVSLTSESLPPCVRDETNVDGLRRFGQLLAHTLGKIHMRADQREAPGFIQSYTKDYALLEKVFPTIRDYGLVKIFTAYDREGNPASGAVLLVSNTYVSSPMALWWLGGSTAEGNKQGVSVTLQWSMIAWLARNGYLRYYMGGIWPEGMRRGPTNFKKGFGGDVVVGHSLQYSPLPLVADFLGRDGAFYRLRN